MKLDKFLSRYHFNFKLPLQCEAFHVKKNLVKDKQRECNIHFYKHCYNRFRYSLQVVVVIFRHLLGN